MSTPRSRYRCYSSFTQEETESKCLAKGYEADVWESHILSPDNIIPLLTIMLPCPPVCVMIWIYNDCVWVVYFLSTKQNFNSCQKNLFSVPPLYTFAVTVCYDQNNFILLSARPHLFHSSGTLENMTPDSLSVQTRKKRIWPVTLVTSCPLPKAMNLSLHACDFRLFSV